MPLPSHDVLSPTATPACRNTQIIDTCIIFPSWHISSTTSFVLSFIVIVLLGILYEYLRLVQHRLDVYIAQDISNGVRGKGRARSPLRSGSASPRGDEDRELLTGRKLFRVSSTGLVQSLFVMDHGRTAVTNWFIGYPYPFYTASSAPLYMVQSYSSRSSLCSYL